MNILLHSTALEPARWTPQKVSRPLAELLPTVSGAGFYKLEIFEPHLSLLPDEPAMVPLFAQLHLLPTVLDSQLDLSPRPGSEPRFQQGVAELLARVDRFGFSKVCLSPGERPPPGQTAATIDQTATRLRRLAEQRPDTEFLLVTRDDSLADDPALMVTLAQTAALPNVGLLWQPTTLVPDAIWSQWQVQQPWVRHFHLRDQTADGGFCRRGAGVVPWERILAATKFGTDVSLELVPSGICPVAAFDLSTSVQEAVDEFEALVKLET